MWKLLVLGARLQKGAYRVEGTWVRQTCENSKISLGLLTNRNKSWLGLCKILCSWICMMASCWECYAAPRVSPRWKGWRFYRMLPFITTNRALTHFCEEVQLTDLDIFSVPSLTVYMRNFKMLNFFISLSIYVIICKSFFSCNNL